MKSDPKRSRQWSASEQPNKIFAGILAVLVHGIFIALLMVNVDWRNKQPEEQPLVAQVWQSLPDAPTVTPSPPSPPEPIPSVKQSPPPPPVVAPDIALKAPKPHKEHKEKPKVEPKEQVVKPSVTEKKHVQVEAPKKVENKKESAPQPVHKEKPKAPLPDANQFLSETTKSQILGDVAKLGAQTGASRGSQAGTANAGAGKNKALIAEYKAKIQAKIRRNVNRSACTELSSPEVVFSVALLPSGELKTNPQLRKTSGSPSCDDAVEAAIRKSEPLPLPPAEADLFDEFRQLSLRFKPTDH